MGGEPGAATPHGEGHWQDHRALAVVLRVVVAVLPFAASVAAGIGFGTLLPRPHTGVATLAWWVSVLAVSAVALRLADRLTRRLLPIAVLLELSLLFPQRAPSRFKLALQSGSGKHIREHVEAANRIGLEGDPAETAENILTLVAALTTHHRPSRKHSERVRAYTDLLAEELALSARDRHRLRWAALLHDVGKVSVPVEILEGTGALDAAAWEQIQRHPMDGARLVHPLWDWLGPWAPTVEQHHERFDGKGYPHGLAGEDICLGARIVTVADSFEAMTARRSYNEPMSLEAARERLAELSGEQFDPGMVRAFLGISIRRLRWAYGPIAWFVEAPVLAGLTRLAPEVLASAGRATAAALGVSLSVAAAGGPHNLHVPVLSGQLVSNAKPANVEGTSTARPGTKGAGPTPSAGAGTGAIAGGGSGGPGTGTTTTGGTSATTSPTAGAAGGDGSGGGGGGAGGSTTTLVSVPGVSVTTPSTLPVIGPIPTLPPGPSTSTTITVPPVTTTTVTIPHLTTTTTVTIPKVTTTTLKVTIPPVTTPTTPKPPPLPLP
ncbi:MAG TPA: HD-GYP domain-containing protein [Acidimicrobiales bacterium]|nr:HD-GYP domain-containing protein [Acidimicrobiales bacterium]